MDIHRIAIGADHAGFALKENLKAHLENRGFAVVDVGAYSTERSDYPDAAAAAAEKVCRGEADLGVLCCGSGIGMAMTANRFPGIRAVVCGDLQTVRLSRQHNDANVICFGARIIAPEYAQELLDAFITIDFEGGRHQTRVNKMDHVQSGDSTPCPS